MGKRCVYYVNPKREAASKEVGDLLKKCVSKIAQPWDEIVFLCIGSDRITGDSLGPFIGHHLSKYHLEHVHIYGTLENPVHALNLSETLDHIKIRHPTALIIAVDASLGSEKHVGFITIGTGPICPGAGVNKCLPAVGDVFITGILNISGTLEHLLLQTTRLSLVVEIAETIISGILRMLLPVRIHPDHPVCISSTVPQPDQIRRTYPAYRFSERM